MTQPAAPIIEMPREMFKIRLVQSSTEEEVQVKIRPIGFHEVFRVPAPPKMIELFDGKSERWVVGSLNRKTNKFQVWQVTK